VYELALVLNTVASPAGSVTKMASAYRHWPKLRGHLAVFILATALTAYFVIAAVGVVFGVRTIMRMLLS
jgi:hypothetical protein